MPSAYHHALRNATIQPSSSASRILIPHLYDRVNDAYGPGVVAAWILVAFGIIAQRVAPLEGQLYRNIDKDLIATILYPVCVAGDLIRHVRQYPGPNGPYGPEADQDAEFGPYAMEILASTQVCLVALGWNAMFMGLLRKSRKRVRMIAIATLWIVGALCFAGWHENWFFNLMLGYLGITGPIAIVILIPVSLMGATFILVLDLALIRQLLWHLVQRKFDDVRDHLLIMGAWVGPTVLLAAMSGSLYYYICIFIFPTSAHSVFEMFQLLALGVGLMNLLFSMHGIVKIWWPPFFVVLQDVWATPLKM